MRKLFLFFLFLLIPTLSSAQYEVPDPKGFMGYNWDTNFETISNVKILKWSSSDRFGQKMYLSYTDTKEIYEKKHALQYTNPDDLTVLCFYYFTDEKLSKGSLVFKNKPDFNDYLEFLITTLGKPDFVRKDGSHLWISKSSLISANPATSSLGGTVNFVGSRISK